MFATALALAAALSFSPSALPMAPAAVRPAAPAPVVPMMAGWDDPYESGRGQTKYVVDKSAKKSKFDQEQEEINQKNSQMILIGTAGSFAVIGAALFAIAQNA